MSDRESSSSSSSPSRSNSEGEYVLPEESEIPKFDFSSWNPEPPAGLSFLGLLPVGLGYEVTYPQHRYVGKIKASSTHRRARRREFTSGKTIGRDIHDERRLRQAANSNDHAAVEELLDSGVDPCCVDDKKRSPLHFAAAKGNEKIVSLLLDKGANPNQKDTIGNTPLHLAACTNHVQVITLLLKGGTDVNSFDNSGRTPLHLAHSRLQILQDSQSYTSEQLKAEVMQIINMMQVYLHRQGQLEDADQLNTLCDQLQRTSTREEMDVINGLLRDFTTLTIEKKEVPG